MRASDFRLKNQVVLFGALLAGIVGWLLGYHPEQPSENPARPVVSKSSLVAKPQTDTPPGLSVRLDALLAEVGNGQITDFGMARICTLAQGLSPKELREAIGQLVSGGSGSTAMQVAALLADYWIERDPVAGRDWFLGLTPALQNNFLGMLSIWAEGEPKSAFEWLESQSDWRLTEMMGGKLIEALGPFDPDRTLQLLRRVQSDRFYRGEDEISEVSRLYQSLAKKSPEAAMQRAMTYRGKTRADAMVGVARIWAQRDPAAALQWFSKVTDSSLTAVLVPALAKGWAEKDPGAAAEWLSGQPDIMPNKKALAKVLETWVQTEPVATLEWVDKLSTEAERDLYYDALFAKFSFTDPDQAMETVLHRFEKGLSIGKDHSRGDYSGFWNYAAALGPQKALEIMSRIPTADQPVLNNMYRTMLASTTERDFGGSLSLVTKLSPGNRRAEALTTLARVGFRNSHDETLKWVGQLPITAEWNTVRQTIVPDMLRTEPEAAVEMAHQITDLKTSLDAMKNGFSTWLRLNSGGAKSWLDQTSTLSSQEKLALKEVTP